MSDDEAQEILEEMGHQCPDEKIAIEKRHACDECGHGLFRWLTEYPAEHMILECAKCGQRYEVSL